MKESYFFNTISGGCTSNAGKSVVVNISFNKNESVSFGKINVPFNDCLSEPISFFDDVGQLYTSKIGIIQKANATVVFFVHLCF